MLLDARNVSAVSITSDFRYRIDNMMQSLNYIVALVVASAGALAFIVLYNLTNINITERIREIATIKVLGFYSSETAQYVFRENILLTAIAALVGIPLGVISATHQYSAVDNVSMVGALFGVSMPNFWLGLMLVVIFAAGLGWFPSSNFDSWKSIVLPAITLSVNSLAMITRMTRSSMLETIRQDYIRTARAKGLKENVITVKHALRNAMIPIVTTVGLQFGFSLGGAVLVETVFAWPGIGRLLVECIKLKDTPVVVACVLVLATMFSIINLCIDILYAFLDPRIRAQYKTAKR